VSTAAIDFGTVAVLVFVLWLDGWRRVEPGDLAVRRVGFGAWNLYTPAARVGSFALVAWWPPIVLPFVVPASPATESRGEPAAWTTDYTVSVARGRRKLRRAALNIAILRIFGALLLVWIAVGIPLMTARWGGSGLLRGIGGAFLFSAEVAIICFAVLRMSGVPRRTALRKCGPLLSPFTAARAAEIVTADALDGLSPAAQMGALLDGRRFATWLRPWAFDEVNGRQVHDKAEARARRLASSLPAPLLTRIVTSVPTDGGDDSAVGSYCPRCGSRYYRHVVLCSECSDVHLQVVPRA
jgi:hypothetical protein